MHRTGAARGVRGFLSGAIAAVGDRFRRDRGQSEGGDPAYLPPLTRAETMALVDERSRSELGMSGPEFRKKLAAGELPDTSPVRSLAILVGEDRR